MGGRQLSMNVLVLCGCDKRRKYLLQIPVSEGLGTWKVRYGEFMATGAGASSLSDADMEARPGTSCKEKTVTYLEGGKY